MRTAQRALLTALLLSAPDVALGITIQRNFLGGTPPATAHGPGTLPDVFAAAADWWEAAILDEHLIAIDFEWAPLVGNTLAEASVIPPVPFNSALIRFDNDGSSDFFLDGTPRTHEEWLSREEQDGDLGGGLVNRARVFRDPLGDAAGNYDLLSLAVHELGHALGFIHFPGAGLPLPDPLLITAPLPAAGTLIDTSLTFGGHIDPTSHPDALLVPLLPRGVRRLPAAIDILGVAQQSGFTTLNLDPSPIPEPSTAVLLLLAAAPPLLRRTPRQRTARANGSLA